MKRIKLSHFFLFAGLVGFFAHDGRAQTTTKVNPVQFNLNAIPNCLLTSGIPAGVPIILSIVPSAAGVSQFGCYTISGVTITPATATSPATITFPAPSVPAYVYNEVPSGTVNGTNVAFTLKNVCNPVAAVDLHWNGLTLLQGADYTAAATATGCAITMATVNGAPVTPWPGDIFSVNYRTQ